MPEWRNSYLVAGVRVALTSSVGDPSEFLPPGIDGFASPGEPILCLALVADEVAQADPLKRFFPSKFRLRRREGDVAFEGVNGRSRLLGTISPQRDRGTLGLPSLGSPWRMEEEREAVEEALEAFMRACLQYHLLGSSGTLVHAAGVALEGEGYAFMGHTGAGKTTLTRGLPPGAVLGDDLVAVRMPPEGSARPVLYGTPWSGREGGRVAYGGLPLRAAFILHRGQPGGLSRLQPAEALADLAANSPRMGYAGEEEELLDVFSRMVTELPIYGLSLDLDEDVRSMLRGLGRSDAR